MPAGLRGPLQTPGNRGTHWINTRFKTRLRENLVTALLLSLSLLVHSRVAFGLEHPPARQAYVCEALLRFADPRAKWDEAILLENLDSLSATHASPLPPERARVLRAVIRQVRSDVKSLPAAAFPVKQVLIGADAIHQFLDRVTESAERSEEMHDANQARQPFVARPRIATHGFNGMSGFGGISFSLLVSALCATNGHPLFALTGVFGAAACANQVMAPAARSLYLDIINADLLAAHAQGRVSASDDTTARPRAHGFSIFTKSVRAALAFGDHPGGQLIWTDMRVRVPLSESDRPLKSGSPRAPTANELGAAIRRSGEFRLPYDARVLHADLFYYYDEGYEAPVLMGFVRER